MEALFEKVAVSRAMGCISLHCGSSETPQFRTAMTGCTGGAVCLLVLGMAIYMIASSNREIRKLEKEKTI